MCLALTVCIISVENIGPNLSRDLTVELSRGSYKTACKPGMVGDGITGDFTVTKNENAGTISADEQALRDTAVTQYRLRQGPGGVPED